MITSTSNQKIKEVRKLYDKKERDRTGLYYAEGLRILGEMFQTRQQIDLLIAAPDLIEGDFAISLLAKAREQNVNLLEVSSGVFKSMAYKDNPQGMAAVGISVWVPLEQLFLHPGDIYVALDSVADPGNLGSILRTVDAAGGKGVILLDQCTDPYDLSSIRASMGSIFNLTLTKASSQEFMEWKNGFGIPVIGTSDSARCNYREYAYPEGMVLLMGSEREGLHPPLWGVCDEVVAIPMKGRADSLNLAAATAVVLFHIASQRQ